MRELLEQQIVKDSNYGDTTVLSEILEQLTDDQVHGYLSDANQTRFANESTEETNTTWEELQSHGVECHCRLCSML